MKKYEKSKGRIRRLNQRQRKKLHLGQFQQLIFSVRAEFPHTLEEVAYDSLWNDFIDFLQDRKLVIGGMGDHTEVDGVIQAWRGTASEDDRQAVKEWLSARTEVKIVSVGVLVDGWYEYDLSSPKIS